MIWLLLASASASQAAVEDQVVVGSAAQFAQTPEVLVRYEPGKEAEARAAAQQAGLEVLENHEPGSILRCRPGPGAASTIARANELAVSEVVLNIEPNFIVSIPEPIGPPRPAPADADVLRPRALAPPAATAVPNDPRFGELWGLMNIKAPAAWEKVTESPIVVGVIDTGVDYNHEDLAGNMWVNPDPGYTVDGIQIDNDLHGVRFVGADVSGDPMDDNAHGTHCAGTIGAVGNNGIGVVGVNWGVKIMALKFLGANGSGTTFDAIRCIDYAVAQKQKGVDLRVLSNSWGGGGFSILLEEAITRAMDEGILFVAAAGNSSQPNPDFPARYEVENVIAVASINVREELSWFSNHSGTRVHLAAPGGTLEGQSAQDILSTVPNNQYAAFAGTSMATPHVAGAIALAWGHSDHQTKSILDMKQLILSNVRLLPSLSGKTITGGTLDISFLENGGSTLPEMPQNLAYIGAETGQAGAFSLNGSTGAALYILGGIAYQSNLSFLGVETTSDGHQGWVYLEDYPFSPFEFLFTRDPAGLAPYHRVYFRLAEFDDFPFGWFLDANQGTSLGLATSDIEAQRSEQVESLRNR